MMRAVDARPAGNAFAVPKALPGLSGRLDSIQILRAIAVLAVALYHLTVLFPDPHAARWSVPSPIYFGYAGVDLFFLISGFIIMHVTRKGDIDVREFLLKRAFRILPLYWMVTTLILAIWMLRPELVPIRGESPLSAIVNSYLLAPVRQRPLLGVGWTLVHEMQFYILVAILLMLGARRYTAHVLFTIFAAAVVLRGIVDPTAIYWDWKLVSLYSFQFGLGVVVYQIVERWEIKPAGLLILLGVIGFLITSYYATPLMGDDREVPVVAKGAFGMIRVIGFGLASFLILLGALNLKTACTGAVCAAFRTLLIRIGDASFVIYLSHNLVLQVTGLAVRKISPTMGGAILGSLFAIAAIIVSGILLHRWLERPLVAFFEQRVMPRVTGHRATSLSIAAQRDQA